MKYIRATFVFAALTAVTLSFSAAHAETVSEVHVSREGVFSGKNLSIVQKSGTNLAVRATWGQAFMRITVLMNASTTVTKNHGEKMERDGVKEGDIIDAEGALSAGADSIIVNAVSIRDVSQESESKTLTGKVKDVNHSELSFFMPNTSFGETKVVLSASTPIKKGVRSIEFSEIRAGDKILTVSGTYDYKTNTLQAYEIEVYQDKTMFLPRNFQGTLKSISGTELPTVLVLTIDGSDYTAYLAKGSSVMRKNRGVTSLVRYAIGDTLRVYGGVRETNFTEIDTDIVRDLNF